MIQILRVTISLLLRQCNIWYFMKKIEKMKMITGAGAVEKRLSNDSINKTVQNLPAGHPLMGEVASEQSKGDLSGLPDGHPLRIQLAEAEARYVKKVEEESSPSDSDGFSSSRMSARRQKAESAKRERDLAQAYEDQKRDAFKSVNKGLEDLSSSLRSLMSLVESQDSAEFDGRVRRQFTKIQRFIGAVDRGINDCKMR